MSLVSSNSLFHFTKSANSLIGILKNNFYPRYCYESYSFSTKTKTPKNEGGIPMVSFCDLSLSQIKKHLDIYGHYGLGMRKGWGKTKGINPLLYISPDSILARSIENLLYNLVDQKKMVPEDFDNIINILSYIKPYDGLFIRKNKKHPNYRFYDEREWRYIPDLSQINSPLQFLEKNEYNNSIELVRNNSSLENYPLTFIPNDIKYVIIKSENEISSMINALREIKGHYSPNTIDILTSKIITTKQIMEDF